MAAPNLSARVEQGLDRLHARVRQNPFLQRFTLCTRILLGIGFIPPALVKIQGHRFTLIPTEHPIGYFFEAMYRTGAYWNFIGWAQLIGAVLLLSRRTATLGAVIFFPIILNIFVITVSMHFAGTSVVTALMLLACTYLLCWDYGRLKPLLWSPRDAVEPVSALPPRAVRMERVAYAVLLASGLGVTLSTRGYMDSRWIAPLLVAGLASGLGLLTTLVMELRARRAAAA